VQLAGQPGWQGSITRLRLDPVGVGDGGTIRVEWVRLIPLNVGTLNVQLRRGRSRPESSR
jgi:hypothetical protein